MAESGIPHAWDGAELVIHLNHEAEVDAIVEAIEDPEVAVAEADGRRRCCTTSPSGRQATGRLDTLLATAACRPSVPRTTALTLVIVAR